MKRRPIARESATWGAVLLRKKFGERGRRECADERWRVLPPPQQPFFADGDWWPSRTALSALSWPGGLQGFISTYGAGSQLFKLMGRSFDNRKKAPLQSVDFRPTAAKTFQTGMDRLGVSICTRYFAESTGSGLEII